MNIAGKNVKLKDGRMVTIRSAAPEDAEIMLRHLRISHAEAYQNLNNSPEFWEKMTVAEEEKILTDFATSPSKFILVALSEGRIVGGLGLVAHSAEFVKKSAILGMSVQEAFCNSGLGTELVRHALEQAREIGLHRVELAVRVYNKPGIALYEKMGFERVGLLKDAAFIDGKFVDEYSYQTILK